MKRISFTYLITLCALGLGLSLVPSLSDARDLTLTLQQLIATDITDDAGSWHHEGGKVLCPNGNPVGNYAAYRRLTTDGNTAKNTAMVTITLFMAGETPPQNITLQGAYDDPTGNSIGSVSAASVKFKNLRDQSFSGNGSANTVTIGNFGNIRQNPCK